MSSSSRRTFIKRGGLVLASAAILGSLPRSEPAAPRLTAGLVGTNFELIRPDDQLALHVSRSFGFETVPKDGGYVLRALGNEAITVRLPAQHIMEWATVDRPGRPVYATPTLLRFHVQPGTEIPLSTAGFLAAMRDMALQTHSLAGTVGLADTPTGRAGFVPTAELFRASEAYLLDAQRRGAAVSGEVTVTPFDEKTRASADAAPPFEHSTRLAVSSRLIITPPGGQTRFTHANEPVRHGKPWAETWYTRLTVKTADGGRVERPLATRAIAMQAATTPAADLDPAKLSALTVGEADAIVSQNTVIPADPDASAIRMSHLHLSPRLGATTRLDGKWPAPAAVKSFSHTVSTGRDVFFRSTVTGTLFPLGHPALRTVTIERQFDPSGLNGRAAVLRKQTRITIKKNSLDYPWAEWPFQSVELLDDSTPTGGSGAVGGGADYLTVDNKPYQYRCRGIDKAGGPVEFTMPLIFVPDNIAPASLPAVVSKYRATSELSRVSVGRVNVAQPGPAAGATEVVGDARFDAEYVNLPFVGTILTQKVTQYIGRLPALGDLTDQAQSMVIRYADQFKQHGFGAGNTGEVVFSLAGKLPVRVTDAPVAGGLFNELDLAIEGTSRKLGPVAALADVAAGTFVPQNYLGETILDKLKLFGIFPLRNLIPGTSSLDKAPTLAANAVDGLRTRRFHWSMPLFEDGSVLTELGARLSRRDGGNASLTVESVVSIGNDGQPHQSTSCKITDVVASFGLGGDDLIRLPINSIEFVSVDTEKPDVKVHIGDIEFLGVLSYVSRLASLIGGNGFGGARALDGANGANGANVANALVPNGPALDVTPSGIVASYGLAIPSVAVGMFSLENIAFGAVLNLPFQGSPRFDFNFASFDNPFRLTVSALGGGGYLSLGMSLNKGLERVEGSLEFGAQIRIDLKVIKGKVSAMGGIYFKIEGSDTKLTGYLTIHGEVSVLSIITVGVATTLSLTYDNGKVRGQAELCFYVSTFFFSATVRRTFSRTFAGSNGDPTFAELMAPQGFPGTRPWDTYCKAFA